MFKVVWRALSRRRDWERDLDDEMRNHMASHTAYLIRAGVAPDEAARRARLEFGSPESFKELCREAHGLRWPSEILQDLRYGWRMLRRNAGFSAIAILSLALGIAVNMVVFGVINGILLRPLPVPAAERIVSVARPSGTASQSFPTYRDIRDRNAVFESLFAYRFAVVGFETVGKAERTWGFLVTGNYFEGLGIRPALGRFFTTQESAATNGSPWAVISHTCWQRRFGSDPGVIGRVVRINSYPYTIVGVAPPGFRGTEIFYSPEIWLPASMQPQIEGHSLLEARTSNTFWVAGRLKRGISIAEANANLSVVAEQLGHQFVADEGMRLLVSRPGLLGPVISDPVRSFATGVMLLAGLVLLAACTNLASLLAVRSADRHRELAIRISVGASRGRIARQLVTESIPIALLGAGLGCSIAMALLNLLTRWRPALDFPVQFDVTADWRVFQFAFVVAIATCICLAIAPARRAWRTDPYQRLTAPDGPRRRWAFRDVVLAGQIALCCILVTASFVSFRGLVESLTRPLGIDPRGVAATAFDLGSARYQGPKAQAFQEKALELVERIPGVTSAAFSDTIPLYMDQSDVVVYSGETTDLRPANAKRTYYYVVSPGFFRTLGTKLIAGRDFTWHDREGTPPVAVVNRTFAKQILGGADRVGSFFRNGALVQVVGIVEDGKYQGLAEESRPALFVPILQHADTSVILIARTVLAEQRVAAEMRSVIQNLDPQVPVYSTARLNELLSFTYLPVRAAVISLGAFGLLAVLLSITGIYGVAAYNVSRRQREIAIRVAIGARSYLVVRQVLGRTGIFVSMGCLTGLVLGMGASRLLESIVYQATSRDPMVILSVTVTMGAVGIAAAYRPARRALMLDPVEVLRQD
jgi:predicted permease